MSPIAIVGIGCRFPGGSHDHRSYLDFLERQGDGVVSQPEGRWDRERFTDDDPASPGRTTVDRAGFLQQDIYDFEPEFFGISPREAASIDPQQRLLLEVTWEAFEDAGLQAEALRGSKTGVFVGGFTLDNMLFRFSPHQTDAIDNYTATSSSMTLLSNRLSYVFDLRGPSMTVDTACSSSLVALHLACEAIHRGDCDAAVAGGVNVMLLPNYQVVMSKGHFLAPDGRSKTFEADADGYGRGEGAGAVVLMPLDEAKLRGLRVHAVIRATGVNQDGATDGIPMPNGDAQQALIEQTCARAGIAPHTVGYVEAHGTGTRVGDPTEMRAIASVYGQDRSAPLPVASVKAQIGHLEAAAGIAGLIKAVLAVRERTVLPHKRLRNPNPSIPFDDWSLTVPQAVAPWPTDTPLRAAINSFGYGGTNAHALVEAPPAMSLPPTRPWHGPTTSSAHAPSGHEPATSSAQTPSGHRPANSFSRATAESGPAPSPAQALPGHRPGLFPVSDRTAAGLSRRAAQLYTHTDDLWALSSTLAHHRSHLPARVALVAASGDELAQALQDVAPVPRADKLAWVFTGMGPQWWGMGQQLYAEQPVFRDAVDEVDALFLQHLGQSVLADLLDAGCTERMERNDVAQPANLLLQVGLVALLRAWGPEPDAILGHSVGEVAAAWAAGCLSLEDAVVVATHRSRLQQRAAGRGGMLAVALGRERALRELDGLGVVIAANNSPEMVTVAGCEAALVDAERHADALGIFAKRVRVQVPYHSEAMDPLRDEILTSLADITPRAPTVPLFSTLTGGQVHGPTHDANYWWNNTRRAVRLRAATESIGRFGADAFLEIGPHPVLATSIRSTLGTAHCYACLRRRHDETRSVLGALASLYGHGFGLRWDVLVPRTAPIELPARTWERRRHWTESRPMRQLRLGGSAHPLLATPDDGAKVAWTTRLAGPRLSFLREHVVDGVAVLPGAASLEACLALATNAGASSVVEDVQFDSPLVLAPGAELRLELEGERVRVLGRSGDGAWEQHARAAILPGGRFRDPDPIDVAHLKPGKRCDVDEFYRTLDARGLSYGPTFRGVRELWTHEDGALARLQLPKGTDCAGMNVHPALLDSAFQVMVSVVDVPDNEVVLPTSVGRLRVLEPVGDSVWVHVQARAAGPDRWTGDLVLFDDDGKVVAEVRGLVCSRALRASPQWLYRERWSLVASGEVGSTGFQPPVEDARTDGFEGMDSDARPPSIRAAVGNRRPTRLRNPDELAPPAAQRMDGLRPTGPSVHGFDIAAGMQTIDNGASQNPDDPACPAAQWEDGVRAAGLPARGSDIAGIQAISDSAPPTGIRPAGDGIRPSLGQTLGDRAHTSEVQVRHGGAGPREIPPSDAGIEFPAIRASHNGVASPGSQSAGAQALPVDLQRAHTGARPTATEVPTADKPAHFQVLGYGPLAECLADHADGDAFIRVVIAPTHGDAEDRCARLLDQLRQLSDADARVLVVTQRAVCTRPGEDVDPDAAALPGLLRVALNEHPHLRLRTLDVDGPDSLARWVHTALSTDAEELAARPAGLLTRTLDRAVPASLPSPASPRSVAAGDAPMALEIGHPGRLDTLAFRSIRRPAPAPGQVEIEVHAASLNFKDVMKAMGMLSSAALENAYLGWDLGLEAAGVVTRVGPDVHDLTPGDPVFTYQGGALRSHVLADARFVVKRPATMTAEQAACCFVFLTAWYALVHAGRIRAGETVLVHSAAGGVGLAAVQIAQMLGATVIATAGTPEKRAFLQSLGIEHVFDSRTLDFADEIGALDVRIDAVLNALAGPALVKSLDLLAPGGRFLELGKQDIASDRQLGMLPFNRAISFHAIDLDRMATEDPRWFAPVATEVMQAFERGDLCPLPSDTYGCDDVEAAFRDLASGTRIGKVVVDLRRGEVDLLPARAAALAGSWLVTGGLGGFGLATARYLAERGATELILASRRGRSEHAAVLDDLRRAGISVREVALDVCDRQAVQDLVDGLPGLTGVVHAAMAPADAPLGELTADQLQRALGAKARGAWNLHRATRDRDLAHFVLYSSISAQLGNPGQGAYAAANTYLDGLASYRAARGLPACSVSWGALAEVGVVARDEATEAHLRGLGLDAMPPSGALAVLEQALETASPRLIVADIDWNRWAAAVPGSGWTRLAPLLSTDEPSNELAQLDAEQRRARVRTEAHATAAQVLGLQSDALDPQLSLRDQGLDSIVAVELSLLLKERLALDVSALEMLGGRSVDSLVALLLSRLDDAPDDASAQASLLDRILVSAPYMALDDIEADGEVVRATVVPDRIQDSAAPMAASEVGRHLAILGSMACAQQWPQPGRFVWPVASAELSLNEGAVAPAGTRFFLEARSVSVSQIESVAAAVGVVQDELGAEVGRLRVAYHVMPADTFREMFAEHRREHTTESSPYGQAPARPPGQWDGRRFTRTLRPLRPEDCAGHFDGLPAVPVSILGRYVQDAVLDGMRAAGADVDGAVVRRATLATEAFAWAGQALRLQSHELRPGVWACEVSTGTRPVARFELTVGLRDAGAHRSAA